MKQNVGTADRLVRFLFGSAPIVWAVAFPIVPYIYGGFVGLVLVVTGLAGWCGIYRLFSLSTNQEG